jgi:hypothetical protein
MNPWLRELSELVSTLLAERWRRELPQRAADEPALPSALRDGSSRAKADGRRSSNGQRIPPKQSR